jgi:death-on-curing protein
MRYLTVDEVVELHRRILANSGGATGIRDANALDSAVAQPRMTFDGKDLYATVHEKASALGFSLISSHPFVDGNKRIGHAAMETFLVLNGYELNARVDEQESIILKVAASDLNREQFTEWIRDHLIKRATA